MEQNVIVKTDKGPVRGIKTSFGCIFKAIPYAAPPLGELRFHAPIPHPSWDGQVMDCTAFGNRLMQMQQDPFYTKEFYSMPAYQTKESEDAMLLNIWTPALPQGNGSEMPPENGAGTLRAAGNHTYGRKFPVAVWIHGGAFFNGFGHEPEFDGEAFARNGVILVTINYRLGVWGFFAHPDLRAEDEHGSVGNYAILDQIAALRWVRSNIASFGGDADNVTIFGQSAGAMSVQTLLSSDAADGLFRKAILQSGGAYRGGISFDRTVEKAEHIGKRFMRSAGVSTISELRALSAESLQKAEIQFITQENSGTEELPFAPCMDGYVLKDGYDALLEKGADRNIPIMIGTTKNDILTKPGEASGPSHSPLHQGGVRWAELREKEHAAPTYIYYFSHDLKGDNAGAFHSSELWYMFGTLGRSWRPKDEEDCQLSRSMVQFWTSFMKGGDPENSLGEKWLPWTEKDQFIQMFR
ncbi:MAG: carboxylesterase family protein [Lachnospiraceae bacterium]|jgi:carboxylesterase type B|nr:carboxylesterase family protein [Lachnospiraceae bacterium]